MKTNKLLRAVFTTGLLTLLITSTEIGLPTTVFASGGQGGGVKVVNFSGNWSGTISTSFGTGAFAMKISESSGSLSGSVHFGAPIFDSTLKFAAITATGIQFSGIVFNGEGGLSITGTLSPDGSQISGTVTQLGQTYTYVVVRN